MEERKEVTLRIKSKHLRPSQSWENLPFILVYIDIADDRALAERKSCFPTSRAHDRTREEGLKPRLGLASSFRALLLKEFLRLLIRERSIRFESLSLRSRCIWEQPKRESS